MFTDCSLSVTWDPRFLRYDFGPGHPFTEKSRWMAFRLLEDSGFFEPSAGRVPERVVSVPDVGRDELLRFHGPQYLDFVERQSRSRPSPPLDAGDTPSFPGCFEAAAALVSGTLTGARESRDHPDRHSFNPAGGLHHAHPDRASGFCIFNDLAVSIRALLEEIPVLRRVAYIDIDVHHGDGVMYGFYDDGRLLDIDFHQDGRTIFPGTGFLTETGRGDGAGLKVNIPLPPETGDEAFLPLFERVVPTMIRAYRPELILLQSGMDAHVGDRLGRLQYTPRAYERAVDLLHRLAHEVSGGRFVLTGGGGYAPEHVSRGLARVAARLGGAAGARTVGRPLPTVWREAFEREFRYPAPRSWDEGTTPGPSTWTDDRTEKLLDSLGERLGVKWEPPEVTETDGRAAPK